MCTKNVNEKLLGAHFFLGASATVIYALFMLYYEGHVVQRQFGETNTSASRCGPARLNSLIGHMYPRRTSGPYNYR